jgi:PAS domain S-box-containing protein
VSDDTRVPAPASVLEETAEALYEQAPCAYVSTRPDGTIVRANQTFFGWTGYQRDTLLGQTRLQHLMAVGSRIYFETHVAPLLQMQGFAREIALELRCAPGMLLPVILNAVVRKDDDGTPLFVRVTLFDSTDRRRYEHELRLARRRAEQAAKDKADLLAMLSHDIRNPLSVMMGVVQMLERSELDDRQRRNVELLKSASGNVLALLQRVLQLSEAESSRLVLQEKPLDVAALINQVVATYKVAADEKRIRLVALIAPDIPAEVLGDQVAIGQILSNLVGNAIKFTERGAVTVTLQATELAADAVTLAVKVEDTGIGIPPERIDSIFDEFTQGSYETRALFGGTGLGLAIARKLLSLYNSEMRVTSTLGRGTTFWFALRLAIPRGQ